MVPKGWSHTTFDKHIDCLTGFAFKSDSYSSEEKDIRLLRGDNIEPGNIRWRNAKCWPNDELSGLDRYHLREGDFVVALDRTWISGGLKVAEIRPHDLPCLLVQRVARVRAKATLEQGLLRQYFSGHKFEQYVKSVQTATAVPHISPNDIKEFPVALPPLQEQKKIAGILSAWDKAITTTEKLLANSQQQKKALMQQLLTENRRLSEFGTEWREYKLGELFKERVEIGYIHLPLLSITSDEGVIDRGDVGRKDTSNADKAKYLRICPNDIGYNTMRMWQGVSGVSDREGLVSPAYTVLIPQDGVDSLFASYLFKLPELVHIFYRYSQGLVSDTWSLKYSHFSKIAWKIPPIEEQLKIARTLKATDVKIETLGKELYLLKQEKKALMQQLLTGKRRVKVGE